jgi:NADPH2:quinone reductase
VKAIQISRTGGPEVLEHVELPTPTPAHNDVLVKADAIGVNYFDTMIRSGRYRWMPKLPFIPGNEMSGQVVAAGPACAISRSGSACSLPLRDRQFAAGRHLDAFVLSTVIFTVVAWLRTPDRLPRLAGTSAAP